MSIGEGEKRWRGELLCKENDWVQLHSKPKLAHLVLHKINVRRNRSLVHTKLFWDVSAFGREIRRDCLEAQKHCSLRFSTASLSANFGV